MLNDAMDLHTALDLIDGHRTATGEAQRQSAARVVDASVRSLGLALDSAHVLAMLEEHEFELRKNDRWECGYFAYGDEGEDLVHGHGATPAEAVANAVAAQRAAD